MNTLGIETSGKISSVAVQAGDRIVSVESAPGSNVSRTLIRDCAAVVEQAGLAVQDIGRIAVGLGPGSFTGIRIGIAAAQSLAWVRDIDVGGISTYRALAAMVSSVQGVKNGVMYVIGDARMDELFAGAYVFSEGRIMEESLNLAGLNEIEMIIKPGSVVTGPGVPKFGGFIKERIREITLVEGYHAPSAEFIIREADSAACFDGPLERPVEPLYMKLSEPERKRRGKN